MTTASKKKAVSKEATKKKATKKKVVKKTVKTKKVPTKKAPAKKAATKKAASKPAKPSKLDITPEERWKMIAIAAYHKAEKRGFAPGKELQDWAEAEKEISKLLLGGAYTVTPDYMYLLSSSATLLITQDGLKLPFIYCTDLSVNSQAKLNAVARQLNQLNKGPRKTLEFETRQKDLTHVLHRPVEQTVDSGRQ